MSKDELARFRKTLWKDFDRSLMRKIGNAIDGRVVSKVANEEEFDFGYEEWAAAPKLNPMYEWAFVAVITFFANFEFI